MTAIEFTTYVNLNRDLKGPKYKQVATSLLAAIKAKKMTRGHLLPSINDISASFNLARDTVERGYKHLMEIGIVNSIPGKGYAVKSNEFSNRFKICLILNTLSLQKKIIFDSLIEGLPEDSVVDLFIYNNDNVQFQKLLLNKGNEYSHCIVFPPLDGDETASLNAINNIPKEKLIVIGHLPEGITGEFTALYEDFSNDLYHVLEELSNNLAKYKCIKIISREEHSIPKGIIDGFTKFCEDFCFQHELVTDLENETVKKGDVYITLNEEDLVEVIENGLSLGYRTGVDFGIISYNENPLKRLILDGITTISTDFNFIGEQAATCIKEGLKFKRKAPFILNARKSL